VKLEVVGPGNQRTDLIAESDEAVPGLYQAVFVPKKAGAHRVVARATGGDGTAIGQAEGGWATDFDADEHRSVRANPALMAALAQRTGGRVVAPGDLDAFVRALPSRVAPVTEPRTRPLWHTPLLFAAALGCLALEWTLRRRRGLP